VSIADLGLDDPARSRQRHLQISRIWRCSQAIDFKWLTWLRDQERALEVYGERWVPAWFDTRRFVLRRVRGMCASAHAPPAVWRQYYFQRDAYLGNVGLLRRFLKSKRNRSLS